MKPLFRNIVAIIVGIVVASATNMGLIVLGHQLVPLPAGADAATMEGLAQSIHLFEPAHFVFPFLAHALGTLAGAAAAAALAATYKLRFAIVIGLISLAGGIANVVSLPAPIWFEAVDLVLAYLPMAWLGGKLGERLYPN